MSVPESVQEPRRRLSWLLVVVGLCLLIPLGAAEPLAKEMSPAERQAKLKKRNRLWKETRKLRAAGKLPAAIEAAEKMLAIERQLFGKDNWRATDARLELDYTNLLTRLQPAERKSLSEADRLLEQVNRRHGKGQYTAAVPLAKKALELRRKVLGGKHLRTGWAKGWLGCLYDSVGDYAKAEPLYRSTLDVCKQVLGEKHPGYAAALNNLAVLNTHMGNYDRAEPRFRLALEIRKQAFGEVHPAGGANFLSLLYDSIGAYAKAEPLFLPALEIDKQALGEKSPAYPASLNNQAVLYTHKGDYATAEAVCQSALQFKKQVLGEKHPSYAATLNNRAVLYTYRGAYAEAEPLFRRAFDIRKQTLGEKHPDYAASLNNLAGLHHLRGDYARAMPLGRQARDIFKQVMGEKHPDYAASLNNQAALHSNRGDYKKAEPLFLQALKILSQALGDKHPTYAHCLNNLAGLYGNKGDYVMAEPLYRQALEIRKQTLGERHSDYAVTLNYLAWLYGSMGDYDRAERLILQSLEIKKRALGEQHPSYAFSLDNQAMLYGNMGDYKKAEPLFLQALKIKKQTLGEKHPSSVFSLENLAVLYTHMGNYAKAEPRLRQVLEVKKQALGEQHPAYALTLDNLAVLYTRKGDYDQAERLFRQARDIRKQRLSEQHPDYAASLNNLAGLHHLRRDYNEAVSLYRQVLDITRQFLGLTAGSQVERQQLAMRTHLRYRLDSYLSAVVQGRTEKKLPVDAVVGVYEQVLAWKGAVFMHQRRQHLTRRHPELATLFDELQMVSRRLASSALAVPAPEQRDAWKKEIAKLTVEKERLESRLARRCAAFDRDRRQTLLKAEQLQALLPTDAVLLDLLEYWHSRPDPKNKGKWLEEGERHLAAFVVRRGRPLALKDLGAAKGIAEAIENWKRAIARKGDGHGGTDPAGHLRQLLWRPLAEAVGDAAIVLVSPDGVLGTFSFAALPGAKGDTYLIEERSVAVVPVPQLLPELLRPDPKEKKDGPPSLLLVGDVNYDAGTGKPMLADASRSAARSLRQGVVGQFPPLAATRGEILAVRDSFEMRFADAKVKALRQAAANESAFRQQAPHYRYLHVATHGFFAPVELKSALAPPDPEKMATDETLGRDPLGRLGMSGYHPGLLSGLALAGANREPKVGEDDGILTALEVASLDLQGVDLAVLSACETGLGKVCGGEGLLGLQRAFQEAGTRTVLASMWQVHDDWTRKLMERFYENMWQKKMGTLAALREAQLWVLRDGPNRGLDIVKEDEDKPLPPLTKAPPYFWAAFVLSGDWR